MTASVRRAPLLAATTLAVLLAGAACRESKEPPVSAHSPLADSADQVMFGVRQLLTERGVVQGELLSDTVFIFQDGTRFELRKVHLTFYTNAGAKNGVLTSREGSYTTRQQRMEARGAVEVTSVDGRRLTTEQLRFDQVKNEISSDSAFVLTEPGRRLEGIGFTSDPNMRFMRCLAACRGEAGAVSLPAAPAAAGAAAATPAAPRDSARPQPLRPGSQPGRIRLPEE